MQRKSIQYIETWITPIIFAILFLFARPWILNVAGDMHHSALESFILFLVIIIAVSTDAIGTVAKVRSLGAKNPGSKGILPILSILRILIAAILALFAIKTLSDIEQITVIWGLFPLFILKEILLLAFILTPEQKNKKAMTASMQVIFSIGISLTYILVWDMMMHNIDLSRYSGLNLFVQMIAIAVMFLLIYLPLQIPFIMEMFYTNKMKTEKRNWVLGLVATFFIIILSLI